MTEEPHVRHDRRHDKAKRIEKLVPVEPGTVGAAALAYLEDLRVRNFSPNTVRSARIHVRLFVVWCHERGIESPQELTLALLRRYQAHLFHHRREDGRRLSFQSQFDRLGGVRRFCRWLAEHGHLPEDPSRRLALPRVEKRLPRGILTAEEAEAILAQPDVTITQGLRDRALLELLYATGMRRGEVERLRVEDLDFAGGVVRIDQGKGKKDRLVPLSERAAAWLQKYLDHARGELLRSPFDDGEVFLGRWGRPLTGGHMGKLVRQYVEASGVSKGSCHMFRHTMATLMLEGGADIRYIQHMLGHESLQSTEIYTHVAIRKLKEVHAATHPAARLARRYRPELAERRADPREELLSCLAAEAAEEVEETEDGGG